VLVILNQAKDLTKRLDISDLHQPGLTVSSFLQTTSVGQLSFVTKTVSTFILVYRGIVSEWLPLVSKTCITQAAILGGRTFLR